MNKYQEAFNNFRKHREYINAQINDLYKQVKNLDCDMFDFKGFLALEELVGTTVKKRVKHKIIHNAFDIDGTPQDYDEYTCPNCSVEIYWYEDASRCQKCGQRLDWSDE